VRQLQYRRTTAGLAEQEVRRLRLVAEVAANLTETLRDDYFANLPR
jgi:hypothetical protein